MADWRRCGVSVPSDVMSILTQYCHANCKDIYLKIPTSSSVSDTLSDDVLKLKRVLEVGNSRICPCNPTKRGLPVLRLGTLTRPVSMDGSLGAEVLQSIEQSRRRHVWIMRRHFMRYHDTDSYLGRRKTKKISKRVNTRIRLLEQMSILDMN